MLSKYSKAPSASHHHRDNNRGGRGVGVRVGARLVLLLVMNYILKEEEEEDYRDVVPSIDTT